MEVKPPAPKCGHPLCNPFACRFTETAYQNALVRSVRNEQSDARDFHHFALLARVSPQLSHRGRMALYSGLSYKESAMNDYADSTTKLFGPMRLELTEALALKQWQRANDISYKMHVELDKIEVFCTDALMPVQPAETEPGSKHP